MSKQENKGRLLVIMAVLFCGLLGAVRICSEEGEKFYGVCGRCVSWLGTKKEVEEFLGFLLRLHN